MAAGKKKPLTAAKAKTLKVAQLKRELKARKQDPTGLKGALLERLLACLGAGEADAPTLGAPPLDD